jgi:hypothetical protein
MKSGVSIPQRRDNTEKQFLRQRNRIFRKEFFYYAMAISYTIISKNEKALKLFCVSPKTTFAPLPQNEWFPENGP